MKVAFLLFVLKLTKKTNQIIGLPHFVKYGVYVMVKNSNITASSIMLGSSMKISLNIGDFIQYWIFMDGIYEKDLYLYLKRNIKNKTLIDVGANIGNFELSLWNEARKIYAIEASSKNCSQLMQNLSLNKEAQNKIIVEQYAVANQNYENIKLYLSSDADGNHTVVHKNTQDEDRFEVVITISLDEYVRKNNINIIDIIKIDVEGAESAVISGAQETINKHRPIIVLELNAYASPEGAKGLQNIVHGLTEKGYKMHEIDKRGLLKQLDVKNVNWSTLLSNIVFVQD